jgi:hypothetical protein
VQLRQRQRLDEMSRTELSKVYLNRPNSRLDFATEDYLIDFLKLLSAQSRLPVSQLLTILYTKQADTVSCSRDDTDYSFFASQRREVISVIIKKLGEETIEFELPSKRMRNIKLKH